MMNRQLYPLADYYFLDQDLKKYVKEAIKDKTEHHKGDATLFVRQSIRIVSAQEYRKPKAGEWFISGSHAAGYFAKNDLTMEFHIGKPAFIYKTLEVVDRGVRRMTQWTEDIVFLDPVKKGQCKA